MPGPHARIFNEMLNRLYAAITSGPGMNCRPHTSRQRIDLAHVAALFETRPEKLLAQLLVEGKPVSLSFKATPPLEVDDESQLDDAQKQALKAWREKQKLLNKLRIIAEDARTFEQDTGARALHIGFPVLSIPPGHGRTAGASKRILAPIAFVEINLEVARGRTWTVELSTVGEGADLVVENAALLSWIEQQTGKRIDDVFQDQDGEDPYREINELVTLACKTLDLPVPAALTPDAPVAAVPGADEEQDREAKVLLSAVIGLFPMSNQSLIHDTEELMEEPSISGPLATFVQLRPDEPQTQQPSALPAQARRARRFAEERYVTQADPCQSRAVRLSRQSPVLAVHGPPGTGKSQTIANMIGDHLSRGERVLLVCDKRTAIDVVYNRLKHLGLGDLCAVIHDAQRDQRDLYMGVRNQLEKLGEAQMDGNAAPQIDSMDSELQRIHSELLRFTAALQDRPEGGAFSFHELMGLWLERSGPFKVDEALLQNIALRDVEGCEKDVREVLQRGLESCWRENPWAEPSGGAAGITLADFTARDGGHWKNVIEEIRRQAADVDVTAQADVPPFPPDGDADAIGRNRAVLGETMAGLLQRTRDGDLQIWVQRDAAALRQAAAQFEQQQGCLRVIEEGPLDIELHQVHRSSPLTIIRVGEWMLSLDAYLEISEKWYSFLCFGRKGCAQIALERFGLPLTTANAQRVRTYLHRLRARLVLEALLAEVLKGAPLPSDDAELVRTVEGAAASVRLLLSVENEPMLRDLSTRVRQAFSGPGARPGLLSGLKASATRGSALAAFERKLESTGLFADAWRGALRNSLRQGGRAAETFAKLDSFLPQLESVLRLRARLADLPPALVAVVRVLLDQSADPDAGWRAVHRAGIGVELGRRLRQEPLLVKLDDSAITASMNRYRQLEEAKRERVRAHVLALWTRRQRARLLAPNGSRLSSLGADLRRRLMVRGRNAMRLRQVIRTGEATPDGDPLFDLCPVWMASPGTVAQIFPRRPLFDLVIFDEASQCRLEEALPVLMRGKRVVIAGDPKQLPPTRFFESTVVRSEEEDPENDQDLFESQQSETDDLLGAALNTSVEQCYLDVHYRSRCADLIEFSNQTFYDSRLQAIPGHPSNRPASAPMRIHHVGGTYAESVNEQESAQVVKLVRELLRRSKPPSIGIACMNLPQRDLIVDALDEAAAQDPDFATRLVAARMRQGAGSFEGLFVKNLENVQGDERDYMLICTTYGPDANGRFYRRFGPLGRAGGGRRLNVLVTRAREEVHIITSIPREVYRSLAPVPDGQTPNGGYLLFKYLQFAEETERLFNEESHEDTAPGAIQKGQVTESPTKYPSRFARSLAGRLSAEQGISSVVHWGNDGFCVDVALRHPRRADDVTIGLLCDATRFEKAEDRVEWEVFRTAILESQGWKLKRLWTPQTMRNLEGELQAIARRAADFAEARDVKP